MMNDFKVSSRAVLLYSLSLSRQQPQKRVRYLYCSKLQKSVLSMTKAAH